jgi:hypothetical protein
MAELVGFVFATQSVAKLNFIKHIILDGHVGNMKLCGKYLSAHDL